MLYQLTADIRLFCILDRISIRSSLYKYWWCMCVMDGNNLQFIGPRGEGQISQYRQCGILVRQCGILVRTLRPRGRDSDKPPNTDSVV